MMKKLLVFTFILSTMLLPMQGVQAAGSFAEAVVENDGEVNIIEKAVGTLVALPVSPIIGAARGAKEKGSSVSETIRNSEMNVVSKMISSPFIALYAVGVGGLRGVFSGLTNAVTYGMKEEPFSKESFSLHDGWH